MTRHHRRFSRCLPILCLILFSATVAHAQGRERPGQSIGKVSVLGHLILMELNQGVLGRQNLFNLNQRTLRFIPERAGYRVEDLPLRWETNFGQELNSPEVKLRNFSFPFSGKTWDSFSVGVTGSIRFGPALVGGNARGPNPGFRFRDRGGVSIARFAQLATAAGNLVNTVPAICVFFKPRMSGKSYVNALANRVVVTWDVTEPYGNIQDFTWTRTVNRFQAVLFKDGIHRLNKSPLEPALRAPYMYAMSQIGHEMGHRWAAFVSAKVGNETIPLGPVHWAMGLQARVPFPYVRPTEASIMGGGVWQDNFDGTYTQLDDNYYVPATGYSYLDLYLMGLISPAEVPDFFILRHLVPVGKDSSGHRVFKADRTKVTIQDVIAAEGVRSPDVAHSQRHFNTGMVVIVQHGLKPSHALLRRTNGIRKQWIRFFSITTGRRASMTANPS